MACQGLQMIRFTCVYACLKDGVFSQKIDGGSNIEQALLKHARCIEIFVDVASHQPLLNLIVQVQSPLSPSLQLQEQFVK
jgi:hypothetical protein